MKTKQFFLPGSEWLYMKIYCGRSFSDELLGSILYDYLTNLEENKNVENWFFIRYSDPEPHLRLRIKSDDPNVSVKHLIGLEKILGDYFAERIIWDVQVGTYVRELDRYGTKNISICESIFHEESQMIISLLNYRLEIEEYLVLSMQLVQNYLILFFDSESESLLFLKSGFNSFKKEFDIGRVEMKMMNKKYEVVKLKLQESQIWKKAEYSEFIISYLNAITPLVESLKKGRHILKSILHMFVNRVFHSNQREMELMTYHHLEKHYLTKLFKKNKSNL